MAAAYGAMTSDGLGPKGPGVGFAGPDVVGDITDDVAVSVIELTGAIKWFDVS